MDNKFIKIEVSLKFNSWCCFILIVFWTHISKYICFIFPGQLWGWILWWRHFECFHEDGGGGFWWAVVIFCCCLYSYCLGWTWNILVWVGGISEKCCKWWSEFNIFFNLQVIYVVNEVKEEPADTIKIDEDFFCNENKYISSKVGFSWIL